METRLTYPASLRLIRAARRDPSFAITRLDENPAWREDAPSCVEPNVALLARSSESHALRDGSKLSVLVPREGNRSHGRRYCYRICEKNLPAGSFVVVSRPGFSPIVTESPELCVIRAAADLALKVRQGLINNDAALIRLVDLVDELCGRYSRHPSCPRNESPIYDIEPITSVSKIGCYLMVAKRIDGINLARQALRYALDNLGSPMETLLEMACCLPPHLGGLNLPKPVANQPLVFSDHERELVSHVTLRPDSYWERYRIVGEYNGHDHDGWNASAEDDRRVSDYQACSIKVFPARYENVSTGKGLDEYFRKLIDAMAVVEGPRWRQRVRATLASSTYRQARQALLDTMLPPRHAEAELPPQTD